MLKRFEYRGHELNMILESWHCPFPGKFEAGAAIRRTPRRVSCRGIVQRLGWWPPKVSSCAVGPRRRDGSEIFLIVLSRLRGELACSCGAGLRGRPLGLGQALLSSWLGAPSVVESFGSADTSPGWRWWRTHGRSNVSDSKRERTPAVASPPDPKDQGGGGADSILPGASRATRSA